MTLRQGKFYDESGIAVPLEHGNVDQIQLLAKHEALCEKDGVLVTDLGKFRKLDSDKYTCLCGKCFEFEYKNTPKVNFKCDLCGLRYVLDRESYAPFTVVKLRK